MRAGRRRACAGDQGTGGSQRGDRPPVGRCRQAARADRLGASGHAGRGAGKNGAVVPRASRRAESLIADGAVPPRLVLMSGHSKWHSIKHKKAIVDARRGQHFTKLARAVTVAAREGGGEPDGNPALSLAIQRARDASMPKDNIERAIAKGTGEGADADQIETVLYEGYGPGGVALLIEALTENRNRTGADIRHALSKHGGSLGEPGSVSYLFDKCGVIVVDATRYDEDDLIVAIDAGAQDISLDDDVFEVITEPGNLGRVLDALTAAGVEAESADVTQRPKARVAVQESEAARLIKLIDTLEESDDVAAAHAHFYVDADVLERIAG